MLNTNYAKLTGEHLEYLRLPIELESPLIINGVTHPAGAHLSTNDDAAIRQLGYKPVTRTAMPTREGYYYTETWTDTGAAIVQAWEEHEQPPATDYTEVLDIMTGEKA
ncbi:MAG: hypothetical protein KIG30_08330 [Eubacteriales bacterium]|nr:hypothetical protein [Eubacteriales bacterium]